MKKRKKKEKQEAKIIEERPLDPTRNAEDLLGDTTGMTGVTRGTPQQTSAEPEQEITDTSDFSGGVIEHPKKTNPTGIDRSAVSDKEYNKAALRGMSQDRGNIDEELAEDPRKDKRAPEDEKIDLDDAQKSPFEDQNRSTPYPTTEDALYNSPENQGEQESTTSDPEIDDDTLKRAKEGGFQPEETTEKPEEVDAARDIDKAEEYKRTH